MLLIKPSFKILTRVEPDGVMQNVEYAARTCYQSTDKIGSNPDFVKNIIKRGHESVIEHESISVEFNIDRAICNALVRHRHCAFSQESTIYCKYDDHLTFIIPPWIDLSEGVYPLSGINFHTTPLEEAIWLETLFDIERSYHLLLKEGWSPQKARSILPNTLAATLVMTTNLRSWRHIFKVRTMGKASIQMKEIMRLLLIEFQILLPDIFEDIIGR